MKTTSVPFAFLRVRPDEIRGEQLNIGLVTFGEEGPRVYIDAPHWRVRAFHPDLDTINWVSWGSELERALASFGSIEQGHDWAKSALGVVRADDALGLLTVNGDLDRAAQEILSNVVSPPQRTIKVDPVNSLKPRTRLHTQLRSWFKTSKVFSSKVADLSQRKVVPSFPIDTMGDLYADFALKNGVVHIMETVDFRGQEKVTKALRGEAGLTSVLFDQANRVLEKESKKIAVCAADDYQAFKPLFGLIGRYADDVYHLESNSDRQRLADFVASSLHVSEDLVPLKFG